MVKKQGERRGTSISLVVLFITSVLQFCLGISAIISAFLLYRLDSDIEILRFQIWVGVPLLVCGALGAISVFFNAEKFATQFLIGVVGTLALLLIYVCGYGAIILGVKFWEDDWQIFMPSNNQCVQKDSCWCPKPLPLKLDNCDDIEGMYYLFIVEIAMSAIGTLVSFLAAIMAVALTCAKPIYEMERSDSPDGQVNMIKAKAIGTLANNELIHYSDYDFPTTS